MPSEVRDELDVLGVMDTDAEDTEGIDVEATEGLPFTECALKLLCGDPGRGCV